MNLSSAELNQIRIDNPNAIKETIYAMFIYWRQKEGRAANPKKLGEALIEAQLKDFQEVSKKVL